MKKQIVFWSVN